MMNNNNYNDNDRNVHFVTSTINKGFYSTVDLPMFRVQYIIKLLLYVVRSFINIYVCLQSGFRYYHCESYQHKPFAFRTIPFKSHNVQFSLQDRSPHVELTLDCLSIKTNSGFRSARTCEPIRSGNYYFEVKIDKGGGDGGSHVRIGVCRREGESGAPVGYDGYSYGYRDLNGHKVHLSRTESHGKSFKTGDVVGVLIKLPVDTSQPSRLTKVNDGRIPINFRNNLWFEVAEYLRSKEMDLLMEFGHEVDNTPQPSTSSNGIPHKHTSRRHTNHQSQKYPLIDDPTLHKLKRIPNSKIEFYVNGEKASNDPAFENLLDYLPIKRQIEKGKTKKRKNDQDELDYDDGFCGYYPMVSVFKGGQATLNPGPSFAYPPNTQDDYKPLNDRFDEFWHHELKLLDDEACDSLPDLGVMEVQKSALNESVVQDGVTTSTPLSNVNSGGNDSTSNTDNNNDNDIKMNNITSNGNIVNNHDNIDNNHGNTVNKDDEKNSQSQQSQINISEIPQLSSIPNVELPQQQQETSQFPQTNQQQTDEQKQFDKPQQSNSTPEIEMT